MTAEPIPYYEQRPSWISRKLPDIPYEYVQGAFMVATLGCTILTLIPPVQLAGALSLRSISCAVIGVKLADTLKQDKDKGAVCLQIMRLASVAIGLAGVASHLNILMVSGIGIDIISQAAESARGFQQNDIVKSLSHLSFTAVDIISMLGILTGDWPFFFTASILNFLLMGTLFAYSWFLAEEHLYNNNNQNWLLIANTAYYIALTCLGLAGFIESAIFSIEENFNYIVANHGKKTMKLIDHSGHIVARVKPGETVRFSLYNEAHVHVKGHFNEYYSSYKSESRPNTEVLRLLPIDATSIAADFPCQKGNPPPKTAIQNKALDAFLEAPSLKTPPPLQPNDLQICLIHKQSRKSVRLDLEYACEESGFFNSWCEEDYEDNSSETITLDFDKKTFDWLVQYFQKRKLNLHKLRENELLNLHDAAENMEIEKLKMLCQREIALRLKHFQWKNTDFLEAYRNSTSSLTELVALLNLSR